MRHHAGWVTPFEHALLIVAAVILALAFACGDGGDTRSTPPVTTSPTTTEVAP